MDILYVIKQIYYLAILNNGQSIRDVSLAITFLFEALSETRRK